MNNKGQGMSTSTIILLVLGLIVLAILSIGFMTGWKAFSAETGKTNVDDVVEECSTTCSLNQKFSFCSAEKELRFAEEDFKVLTSCAVLASEPSLKIKYGIADCPQIDCKKPCAEIKIDSKAGFLAPIDDLTTYDVTSLANDVPVGQKCAIN